jgi:hypothetical protein
MDSDFGTAVIGYLHVTANRTLCARIEHGITDGVLAVCGIKGYLARLVSQGKVDQSVRNHEVELIWPFFNRHLCSILHDERNTFCLDQAVALTDKQGLFGDRSDAGHFIGECTLLVHGKLALGNNAGKPSKGVRASDDKK